MEELKLIKPHKNKEWASVTQETTESYIMEEITEIVNNEIIITTSIKINPKSGRGKKLINDMIEKQNSPIKKVLQEKDKNLHTDLKEDKGAYQYDLPEEFKKKFGIKDYNDYYTL